MREGWTEERLREFWETTKEVRELAAKHNLMVIPTWLDDDELREYMTEHYMVNNPEMTEEEIHKRVEELIRRVHEFETDTGEDWMETSERHYIWALTDPEMLKKDLREQYRRVFPEMSEEEIEKNVAEDVEHITTGALRRYATKS